MIVIYKMSKHPNENKREASQKIFDFLEATNELPLDQKQELWRKLQMQLLLKYGYGRISIRNMLEMINQRYSTDEKGKLVEREWATSVKSAEPTAIAHASVKTATTKAFEKMMNGERLQRMCGNGKRNWRTIKTT